MSSPPETKRGSWLLPGTIIFGVIALTVGCLLACGFISFPPFSGGGDGTPTIAEATKTEVDRFCAHCHKYPPPNSFPRSCWREEVERGYGFFEASPFDIEPPSKESVIKYYEKRAPEEFPPLPADPDHTAGKPLPVRLERQEVEIPGETTAPAISHVNLVHLFDKDKLDVLYCDMRGGKVGVFSSILETPKHRVLGKVRHPAHAEVVDLDKDGIKDVIVADLGNFFPTNDRKGRVVLLKGTREGKFIPYTLLENVGRVADVQAADFNGDGKLDLIVAVFGWRTTGEIIYLENQTMDWRKPKFVPHVVDDRHGAIHVPVADLNGDGKPDFVGLISQEHETIVAFLNRGVHPKTGKLRDFEKKVIFTGPHPAYGSSGIQLVDLNNDGKLDVLYTNGDVMDSGQLRPYHSVQWLENQGSYPFKHHHVTAMYGVHRAVAADLDGDGLPDIVAVCCLPEEIFKAEPRELRLDSVILLRQKPRGKLVRYSVEKSSCDHVSCAVGDLAGDGKMHLVVGNFFLTEHPGSRPALTIWKNLGKSKTGRNKPGQNPSAE
jgi:hypothetical protein